ncbi:MAG TPA: hypothetical protein DCY88_05220, partial [Cyanobacteria bacterium UBA11372]|nr:hypothetical protein [Cyanobacteria bacterium UBA11372]
MPFLLPVYKPSVYLT